MIDESPACACPAPRELLQRGLEGKAVAACPAHRPFEIAERGTAPVALNDGDALAALILGALDKHTND